MERSDIRVVLRPLVAGLLLVVAGSAAADALNLQSSDLFDKFGAPTGNADVFTAQNGLPKLVEGAPFRFTDRQRFERQPGCVTAQFLITPQGQTDKFLIVDSQPKGYYDETMLESLKFWKFATHEYQGWVQFNWNFIFEAEIGSHLGKSRKDCITPEMNADTSLPVKLRMRPYYPPTQAQAGVAGCATIGFSVTRDGKADDYEIIDTVPAGQKDFVQAGLHALNLETFPAGADPKKREYARYDFALKGHKAERECNTPGARKPEPMLQRSGKY